MREYRDDDGHNHKQIYYFPIYEFVVNGKKYKFRGTTGYFGKENFKIDKRIEKSYLIRICIKYGIMKIRGWGRCFFSNKIDYSVYIGKTESEKEVLDICVPKVNGERISAEDIDTKIDDNSRSYTVITASDTASGNLSGASYAYLCNSEKVYCSADTLYFTYSDYSDLKQRQTTVINAIGLSKDKISKKAEGSVYGHINNQFSMDEYDGYLRIGTTGYNSATFKDESNLYVLDDELKLVGELEDIADNEEIKSVRFAGNKAYVVTFEQTDPMFVIDLSKPAKPKISGYVKLPGYSTYLHPVGADYLVGVGFGGSEKSADLSALKVTLFDVSNPEKPKVVSNFEVCEASTEITQCDNHKALLYYPEKNLIGIPVKKRIFADTFREVYSYAMLEIKDGELGLKNGFTQEFGTASESFIPPFDGSGI